MAIKFLKVMPSVERISCHTSWGEGGARIVRWLLDFGKFMYPLCGVTENSCKKINQE